MAMYKCKHEEVGSNFKLTTNFNIKKTDIEEQEWQLYTLENRKKKNRKKKTKQIVAKQRKRQKWLLFVEWETFKEMLQFITY